MWRTLAAVGIAVTLTGAAGTMSAAQRSAPKGNAANGQKVYMKDGCYQCHGREAQGGGAGSRLGPEPWSWEQFSRYVRQPRAQMPPYGPKILSDAELADIYAFVEARPGPTRVTVQPPSQPQSKR